MNKADEYLLASLRQDVLADLPDDQWQMVTDEVEKAGGVRQVGGYAATIIRKAVVEKKSKIETVMGEFKEGKLRSSSGKKVKSRKQAIAIALSEQRRVKKEVEEIAKASFGGNRSEAGRYAANVRWQKQGKGDAGRSAALGAKYPKARAVVDLPARRRSDAEQARIEANVRGLRAGKAGNLDELRASLEEARGMLEVEQDLAAAGNKGAADRAKVTADRIRGLERDIKSMESGGSKAPKKSAGVDERTAGMIRDGDLSALKNSVLATSRAREI